MRFVAEGSVSQNPKSSTPVSEYLEAAIRENPNIQAVLPWWQGWWKIPADYRGNVDHAGTTPEPKEDLSPDAGMIRYRDTEFIQAAYGRLSGEVSTANPWFAQFGDEWVANTAGFVPSSNRPFETQKAIVSQASESLRDFYLWGYNDLMERSKTKALYFDVSRPVDDTNIYRGGGVLMPDGSIEPTHNILGMREAFKRIYTLLKQKHPDGQVYYHSSGAIMLPLLSFVDANVNGENYGGLLDRKENRGYERVLSIDQVRAEYSMQNNIGPGTMLLPQFERAKSIKKEEWNEDLYQHIDYILGLTLLHDSNIWWIYVPVKYLASIYTKIIPTGLSAEWTFLPYWHENGVQSPEGVYTSLYQSPDQKRMFLVAMNTSATEQKMEVPLTIGPNTFTEIEGIYVASDRKDGKGALVTAIPGHGFVMYLLK